MLLKCYEFPFSCRSGLQAAENENKPPEIAPTTEERNEPEAVTCKFK